MSDGVLVVGGGFAGFWAAMAARRTAGDRAPVTLVSRDPVLQMRPRLYEARPESLGVDLRPLLGSAGIRFVAGEATGIDIDSRSVLLRAASSLPYGRLVVATGSRMQRPPVDGADEAYSIDTRQEAIDLDRRLAVIAGGSPAPRVAIVGAGFTGIELALEMRDRLAAHGGAAAGDCARIVLLDRADVVGPELGSGPRAHIEAALADARVELRLAVTVAGLGADHVTLADGSVIAADAVVVTTGMVAAPLVGQLPGKRDALGRLVVDRMLQAPQAPGVFVTGDSAAADTGDGHLALQSCQHALQTGRFAGENAARDLLGLPLLPYAQPRYVTCLDLGRSGAVLTQGWDRTVLQAGPATKALKQRINRQVIYPPAGVSGNVLLAMSSTDPAEQQLPAAR